MFEGASSRAIPPEGRLKRFGPFYVEGSRWCLHPVHMVESAALSDLAVLRRVDCIRNKNSLDPEWRPTRSRRDTPAKVWPLGPLSPVLGAVTRLITMQGTASRQEARATRSQISLLDRRVVLNGGE